MTNGKLLTTKGQLSTKMAGVSTMTKFRTEQALVASDGRGLNEGSNPPGLAANHDLVRRAADGLRPLAW
jgi:hypothetical protein